jgi:dTMP kinase
MNVRSRRRGRLIALEGIDGVGKSTLLKGLSRAIRRRGYSVALHREPTDPKLGALAQGVSREDPWTGAVYFTVDRYLARPVLEQALARYDIVLSDRSFYSTLAYQGSALPPRERRRLDELERVATVAPDRILWLSLPPKTAVGRLGGRRSARGPLERIRVLRRVARAYRELARGPRWIVLDARRAPEELVEQALAGLRLPSRRTRSRPSRQRR